MKSNWKPVGLAMLALLALLSAGCSGINASGSVSPATFFLPGLMKADPAPSSPAPVFASAPAAELALAQ